MTVLLFLPLLPSWLLALALAGCAVVVLQSQGRQALQVRPERLFKTYPNLPRVLSLDI